MTPSPAGPLGTRLDRASFRREPAARRQGWTGHPIMPFLRQLFQCRQLFYYYYDYYFFFFPFCFLLWREIARRTRDEDRRGRRLGTGRRFSQSILQPHRASLLTGRPGCLQPNPSLSRPQPGCFEAAAILVDGRLTNLWHGTFLAKASQCKPPNRPSSLEYASLPLSLLLLPRSLPPTTLGTCSHGHGPSLTGIKRRPRPLLSAPHSQPRSLSLVKPMIRRWKGLFVGRPDP